MNQTIHRITEAERGKYDRIWALEAYHEASPGVRHIPLFERMMRLKHDAQILDIGAGSGAASRVLKDKGYDVEAFDLTNAGWAHDDITIHTGSIWHDLPRLPGWLPYEVGYCCDVMEHLPTQFVGLAVRKMLEACGHVFLSIAFLPEGFGDCIGERLHLTVENFVWWRDTLREVGLLHDARDLIGEGVFHVGR